MKFVILFIIFFSQSLLAQEDSYHNWLKNYIDTAYSVTGGEWMLSNNETSTNNIAQLSSVVMSVSNWNSEEPFTKKITFINQVQRQNSWDAAVRFPISTGVNQGDALLLVIWVKATAAEFGNGLFTHIFERDNSPWTKSLETSHIPSDGWQMWMVPFECLETYSAGRARYQINMGFMGQGIEVGGIALINYGSAYSIDDLPGTEYHKYYNGQEYDAPWRAEAKARIEEHRMENIDITVVDENNKLIEGASVSINMKKHQFGFGSAVAVGTMIDNSLDSDFYKQKLQDLTGDGRGFNVVVIENALKWPTWESSWPTDKIGTAAAVEQLLDYGLKVRGHNLVWPGWQYLPDDLQQNQSNAEYITNRIKEHIHDVAGYSGIKGKLFEWDVINEAVHNFALADVYGTEDIYADWFNWAEEADPDAKLFLNDYSIINSVGMDFSSQEKYHSQIENLLSAGAKLDGIGIQGHFSSYPLTSPERIYEVIDDFAQHELDIEITEYDAAGIDDDIAADYMRDVLTIAFSHPGVTNFLMWGFWDGAHWFEDAPIFDINWNLKSSGEMFVDLVFNRWWTDASVISDENGSASVRGFLGEYEIVIEYEGYSKIIPFILNKGNGEIQIKLDGVTSTSKNKQNPYEFNLGQNYPNPFNPTTTIEYSLPNVKQSESRTGSAVNVTLVVFDALGSKAATLKDEKQTPGVHKVEFSAADRLASGIYYYRLNAGKYTDIKKMVLLR